jgi:PAS domain S-box-containing protein
VVSQLISPGIGQSVVFDATAQVASEQALAGEQRRYQTLVEQIPAVTFRRTPDGTMEYVSPQIEPLMGYTPAEFIERINTKGWADLVHPDDRARVLRDYPFPEGSRRPMMEAEFRVRTRTGTYRNLLVRRSLIEAPGDASYLQSIAVDLTQLRAAERRSWQAVADLVRAGEDAQARLAVELHDDTLQAMAAMQIQLQRLAERDRSVEDQPIYHDLTQMLHDTMERTRHLMFELRPQLLEQAGLAAMLTDMASDGPWQQADIDITIHRQSPTVEALCYRTLRELVLNARRHAHAHTLRIEGREAGGWLRFSVTDDGVGFDPQAVRRVIGLHVGLETAVERVRLAGGDMTIQSAPGSGARFDIMIPADPARADRPAQAQAT